MRLRMNRACRGIVPLVLIAALSHAASAAQGTDAGGFIQRWLLLEPIRVPGQLTQSAVRMAIEKDFPVPATPVILPVGSTRRILCPVCSQM